MLNAERFLKGGIFQMTTVGKTQATSKLKHQLGNRLVVRAAFDGIQLRFMSHGLKLRDQHFYRRMKAMKR